MLLPGGTAVAAGELVRKLGGILHGYIFLMEIEGLKGKDKLKAPTHLLLGKEDSTASEKP